MALTAENILVKKGSHTILNIDSLVIAPIGMTALIGVNGAGKSTLLKVLGGLEPYQQGSINFMGLDLKTLSRPDRTAGISYIPQHFSPAWNQKSAELLELAAERTKAPLYWFKRSVTEFELAGLLNRPWETLSGGERGRLLLAMALTGAPALVLADEPGASLDIAHNIKMLKTLREKSKHCSALVALHDLNLGLRYFDHILLLSRGVILYSGPPDELFHNNLLDRAFGVKFLRIATENGHFLYPEPSGTPL